MHRHSGDYTIEYRDNMKGGTGRVRFEHIWKKNSHDEMKSLCRQFSRMTLEPGTSVGLHSHSGEEEIYYILSGRGGITVQAAPENTPAPTETSAPTEAPVPGEEWKSNLGTINLSTLQVSGTGVAVDGNIIRITAGGDFTVTGTLDNGKIVVSTTERVKLRLSGASITCNNDSAIFVEQSDKTFITMEKGTSNTISSK